MTDGDENVSLLTQKLNQVIADSKQIETELEEQLKIAENQVRKLQEENSNLQQFKDIVRTLEDANDQLKMQVREKDASIEYYVKQKNKLYEKVVIAEGDQLYIKELERELEELRQKFHIVDDSH